MQRHHVEAVIKVGAKFSLLHLPLQVRLVALITRTSTATVRSPPTRSKAPFSRTRSSLTCMFLGNSATSSRKMVPRCASSKRPFLSRMPRKRPPDVCRRVRSPLPLQAGAAVDRHERSPRSAGFRCGWPRATSSLPAPVSPVIRTV